ncbi:hypothetical protein [Bacillus sp. MUM 13]|uniref:hypothetical protein n=1 Tax=Bacillus sp. MUM 13 TaxID=1678001 RepID=UPI0008F5F5EB|nr:hypothetical protein [Bacillus sp. MUM 13]OIK14862.1 hypothetical protein BIV59_01380 [Bacillus sp. MUM 13]
MKTYRYMLKESLDAAELAEDLKVQIAVNRFCDVKISHDEHRNEIVVHLPEADGTIEDVVEIFMADYKTGELIE